MKYDIQSKYGHYVLYVNGAFYGSYDTFYEAVQDLEMLKRKAEGAATAS